MKKFAFVLIAVLLFSSKAAFADAKPLSSNLDNRINLTGYFDVLPPALNPVPFHLPESNKPLFSFFEGSKNPYETLQGTWTPAILRPRAKRKNISLFSFDDLLPESRPIWFFTGSPPLRFFFASSNSSNDQPITLSYIRGQSLNIDTFPIS